MVIIKNVNIDLESSITCGQCFRFKKIKNNEFILVISDRVIRIVKSNKDLIIYSSNEYNLEIIVREYFDLDRNYETINNILLDKDKNLSTFIKQSEGLKMFKQDPFEMVISYIISQNNRVPRIMNSVEFLAQKYGTKVTFENEDYYLFPTRNQINGITAEFLKESKVGFRDKYILDAIQKINSNEINLTFINNMKTDKAIEYLEKINGIGPKVASCILLFGYQRFDVFPIDTWVKKCITDIYEDIKPDINTIKNFAKERYGEYSAIALQYMFNVKRNVK